MADTDHLPQNTHIPADNGQHAPHLESRRIPPHGDVSPRGDRIWPRPSASAKLLIYGGTALGAAAATAAGILAVRKIADLVSGNDALDREAEHAAEQAAERARARVYAAAKSPAARPATATRFSIMSEPDRGEFHTRARSRMREDAQTRRPQSEQAGAQDGPRVSRPQSARKQGFLDEVESNAQRITRTINEVVGAVGAAVTGFRAVAGQADGILREFGGAADELRSFFSNNRAGPSDHRPAGASFRHRPEPEVADAPRDDARIHRL